MKLSKLDLSFCIPTAIVFIMMISSVVVVAGPIEEDHYIEVTIQDGDTLWGLAIEYMGEHQMKPAAFIDWVTEVNSVNKHLLYPGQTIIIPVKK